MRFASPASRGFERFSLVASCSLFSLVSSRHKKTSEARVHCMASRLALFCPKSAHFACFYKYIRFMCCELLIKQLAGCKVYFCLPINSICMCMKWSLACVAGIPFWAREKSGGLGREGEATPVIILLFSAFFSRAIARLNWLKTC